MKPLRLPSAPLEDAARRGRPRHAMNNCAYCEGTRRGEGNCYTLKELAEDLRVSDHTIYRLRKEGLSHRQADIYAARLGLAPQLIWPEWEASPACPEADMRAAMSDPEFWEYVLKVWERVNPGDETAWDPDDEQVELMYRYPDPCPECGALGACGYDTAGRPLIHCVYMDD